MSHRVLRALPLLLVVLLMGCGGTSAAPEATLESGARELRLTPVAGETRSIRFRMEMGMRVAFGGEELPAVDLPVIAMTTDATVAEVGETIGLDFAYRDLELSGGDEQARAAMEEALGGLAGVSGSVRLTDRGEVVDSTTDLPPTLDPTLSAMMTQFEAQFEQVSIPFPDRPLSVGDAWTASTSFETGGMSQTLNTTYTLVSLDGDAYRIAVEVAQEIHPGPLEGPGGQVVGEIVGGSSTASGEFEGDLGFPVATRGRMTTSGTVRMVAGAGAGAQEMVQQLELTMFFQPSS